MRFKPQREWYIPKNATKVADKLSDAVAYIYTDKAGKPHARVFFGAQAKPVISYYYSNEAAREKSVRAAFENRRAWIARRKERRDERTSWVPTYKVGDILHTCWGYEQTNVEYFQIVEIKGKYAILREIAQERTATGIDQGRCVPLPGQFLEPRYAGDDRGKPIRRLMQKHGIKICDVRTAWLSTPTEKVPGVKVYEPTGWSSYH